MFYFRSMDELDPPEEDSQSRPSVKELVARIQQHGSHNDTGNNSESSDDEDSPLRMNTYQGTMGDTNLASLVAMPNYENVPNDSPRSRSGVYSPTVHTALVENTSTRYIEPIVKIQECNARYNESYVRSAPSTSRALDLDPNYRMQYYETEGPNAGYVRYSDNSKYMDLNARFAKLRMLDANKGLETSSRMLDSNKMFESTTRMLENPQDTVDRDTNNDSGYSTKVYGSSKGNSPSLSGQIDNDCLGGSSLV